MEQGTTGGRGVMRRWIEIVSGPGSGWRTGYWLVLVLLVISYGLCAAQSTTDPSPIAFLVQLITVAVTQPDRPHGRRPDLRRHES
ncbi:hypothetical protein M2317_003645 [Microbacterium sp. ZKA21]